MSLGALTPGTLAIWIATALALVAGVAAMTARPGDHRSGVASRALLMAAAFASLATLVLGDALRRHDVAVDFVARHTTNAVPATVAIRGAFADPSGAGLALAALLGIVGGWWARRGTRPGVAGIAAVTMIVLLAGPLAGRPLARLAWTPVDGQDPLIFFRHVGSLLWMAGLTTAIVGAALTLGVTVDRWRHGNPTGADLLLGRVAFLGVVTAVLAHVWVAVATGVSRDVDLLTSRGGASVMAMLVALGSLATISRRGGTQAAVEGALALTLAAVGLALGPVALPATLAMRGLAGLAFVVALIAVWRSRPGLPRTARPSPATAVAMASALVALTAAGIELESAPRDGRLTSGGSAPVSGGALDHLGLSRYEDNDSDVLALALETRRSGRTRLASAEHREYHDARGGIIGGLVKIPARMVGLTSTVVWLEDVRPGDEVRLTIVDRWPIVLWGIAAGLAGLAVLLSLLPAARRHPTRST